VLPSVQEPDSDGVRSLFSPFSSFSCESFLPSPLLLSSVGGEDVHADAKADADADAAVLSFCTPAFSLPLLSLLSPESTASTNFIAFSPPRFSASISLVPPLFPSSSFCWEVRPVSSDAEEVDSGEEASAVRDAATTARPVSSMMAASSEESEEETPASLDDTGEVVLTMKEDGVVAINIDVADAVAISLASAASATFSESWVRNGGRELSTSVGAFLLLSLKE